MPAASETPATPAPALPHTWRPLGVRLAVYVFGGALLVMIAVVWVAFGPDIRSRFTLTQRATLVLLAAMLAAAWNSLCRSRVTATDEGLVVVNGYRRREFTWPQVIGVSLPPAAPWATLDLSDGTSLSLIGVQGSDGERARRAVREMRAAIAAHSPA